MEQAKSGTDINPFSLYSLDTGLAQKLGSELAKEVSIRQSWQIFNRGEYKTCTEDWLHPADSVCSVSCAFLFIDDSWEIFETKA
jgi:hypothetical protein